MRRVLPLICLALAACHTPAPITTNHTTAKPSATPVPAASATPSPAVAVASGPLQRPAGNLRELAGSVLIDAQYAVSHSSASIIANNGGSAVQLGDAKLISDAGGNIISDNGGGIISDNGGGIIANNGGSLTSKVKFGLLADATPDYGTILPAAGMAVGVEDLTTGQLLTLGQDAAGNPARVIVTDRAGNFHIYLPASLAGAVRVVSAAGDGSDHRLHTSLLASKLGASVQLDDDTAQAANNCRAVLSTAFVRIAKRTADDAQTSDTLLSLLDQTTAAEIHAGVDKINAAYDAAKVASWPLERQQALANRLSDIVLAVADLETLPTISSPLVPGMGGTENDGPALVELTKLMRGLRERVGFFMQLKASQGVDPEAYFAAKDYILEARDRDQADYAIRKPSDFDDFLVRAICANPKLGGVESLLKLATVLNDHDVSIGSPAGALFLRCQAGMSIGLLRRAYTGPDNALPKLLETIAAAK